MAVNTKIENNPDGGFSIVIEEDGSGDLNRIMGELCKKHREAREHGKDDRQTEAEICAEILQAISEDQKTSYEVNDLVSVVVDGKKVNGRVISIDRYSDGRYYDVEIDGVLLKGIAEKYIERYIEAQKKV